MPITSRIRELGLEKLGEKARDSEASGNFALAAHLHERVAIVQRSLGKKEDAVISFEAAARNAGLSSGNGDRETHTQDKTRCESAAIELKEEIKVDRQRKADEENSTTQAELRMSTARATEERKQESERVKRKDLQTSIDLHEGYVKKSSLRTKIGAAGVASFSLLDVYFAGKTGVAHYCGLVISSSAALASGAYASLNAYIIYESKELILHLKNLLKYGDGKETRIADNEHYAKKSSLSAKVGAVATGALTLVDLYLINNGGIAHYLEVALTSAAALGTAAYAIFHTYLAFDSRRLIFSLRKELGEEKVDGKNQ